jgi:hypothetical protein
LSRRDRVLARAVSGPLGRTVAFATDLGALLWRRLRGRTTAEPFDR